MAIYMLIWAVGRHIFHIYIIYIYLYRNFYKTTMMYEICPDKRLSRENSAIAHMVGILGSSTINGNGFVAYFLLRTRS